MQKWVCKQITETVALEAEFDSGWEVWRVTLIEISIGKACDFILFGVGIGWRFPKLTDHAGLRLSVSWPFLDTYVEIYSSKHAED